MDAETGKQLLLCCWHAAFITCPVWKKSYPWCFLHNVYLCTLSCFTHFTDMLFEYKTSRLHCNRSNSNTWLFHCLCLYMELTQSVSLVTSQTQVNMPTCFQTLRLSSDSFDTCNIYQTLFSISIFDVSLMPHNGASFLKFPGSLLSGCE